MGFGGSPAGRRVAAVLLSAVAQLATSVLLPAAAHAAGAAKLKVQGEPIVLGKSESVSVEIEVAEPAGSADYPLRLTVNVGTFSDVTRTAPGRYRAVYVPPETRFPQVALIAVWRETGPEAPIDFLEIALHGTMKLPVSAKAGSEIKVVVGGASFGPVFASAKGAATVPVIVPPGVADATVEVKDEKGTVTRQKVGLDVPPYNRLTAALVPRAVTTDGKSHARLEVFYALGGANVPPSRIKVSGAGGKLTFLAAKAGRYAFRYVPPEGAAAGRERLKVAVEKDPAATASADLVLGLPPPARIVLKGPATALPADGQSRGPVTALVLDEGGLGLPGVAVTISADGKPLEPVQDKGAGLYEASFTAPAAYPQAGLVRLVATAGPATAAFNYQLQAPAAPATVVAQLTPDPVPADGSTEARVAVEIRDEAGRPVDEARLVFAPSAGTVGPVKALGGGRYEATYRPPEKLPDGEATLRIVDAAASFERTVPLPLRARMPGLLAGVRGGFAHDLGDGAGLRGGLDLWLPIRAGSGWAGAGLSVTGARVSQTVEAEGGGRTAEASATVVPIALRLGYELVGWRTLALTAGVGGVATYTQFQLDEPALETYGWGFGGLGFVSLGWYVGPGQAFAELDFAVAPVSQDDFALESGGASVDVGYRFGLF